ncbi:MAG: ATP-grasp domain-containing protein [Pseudomonadales bacterium]
MPRILFLASITALAHNDNHERLPAAFRAAGWAVTVRDHDQIYLRAGRVLAGPDLPVDDFDRVWVLGLGRAATFLDRMQLLQRAPPHLFITPIHALVYQHAKYAWSEYMPETYGGLDPETLAACADDGEWVVKPTAGSFGRGVVRVRGSTAVRKALAEATASGTRYALLQRYVAAIASGETRTLVAGGAVIGSYLRLPGQDFRTNLSREGRAEPVTLSETQCALLSEVHGELMRAGIGYAAIDLAGHHLMEVNLANPGGLSTLARVYGRSFDAAVVQALEPAPAQ